MLGSDNPMNKTVHQTTYKGQQPEQRALVNKEQGRDFRSNHFELATTKEAMPETTMKEAFKNVGKDTLNCVQNPAFQKTHFHVEQDMTAEERNRHYLSIYQGGIGAGVPKQKVEFIKGNNGSTILLGSDAVDGAHYKSEAMNK